MMAGRAQDLRPRSVRPRGLEDRRKGQMPLSPPSFGMVGMACSLARLFLILVVHSADHNDVAKNCVRIVGMEHLRDAFVWWTDP